MCTQRLLGLSCTPPFCVANYMGITSIVVKKEFIEDVLKCPNSIIKSASHSIALENDLSIGMQDRKKPFSVALQNQVYEYNLFRGSNIKTICVVNNVNKIINNPEVVQYQYQYQSGYVDMWSVNVVPYGMPMLAMDLVMRIPESTKDLRGLNKKLSNK